jgi:hypothetical protein
MAQGAWHGKGPLEAYEMANYWDTKFKMNTFGMSIVEVGAASLLCSFPGTLLRCMRPHERPFAKELMMRLSSCGIAHLAPFSGACASMRLFPMKSC